MKTSHLQLCSSANSAVKQCRKCGQSKPLGFFPRDRSRPDERWHTCKLCNQQHGRLVRKAARDRKVLALRSLPSPPRRRLEALKAHRDKRGGTAFEQLSPYLQQQARLPGIPASACLSVTFIHRRMRCWMLSRDCRELVAILVAVGFCRAESGTAKEH